VAVIVLDSEFYNHYTPNSALESAAGRAYAVVDLKNQVYLKAWTLLPGNTVFDWSQTPDPATSYNLLAQGQWRDGPDTIKLLPFPGTANRLPEERRTFFGIVFMSGNGQVKKHGDYYTHSVYVSEGFSMRVGDKIAPGLRPGGGKARLDISLTGNVKIEDVL
jgi:hypothetical protein